MNPTSSGVNPSEPVIPGLFSGDVYAEVELPHVVAPASATSYAGPEVAAIAALMDATGAIPDATPEMFRSVIMASADCDVDGRSNSNTGQAPGEPGVECPSGSDGDPCGSAGVCRSEVCISGDDTYDGAGMVNASRAENIFGFLVNGPYAEANIYLGESGGMAGPVDLEEDFLSVRPCVDLLGELADPTGLLAFDCAPAERTGVLTFPASGLLNIAFTWLGGASCPSAPGDFLDCSRSYPDAIMGIAVYSMDDVDPSGEISGEPLFVSMHFGGTSEVLHISGNPGENVGFKSFKLEGSVRTPLTRSQMAFADGECIANSQ